MYDRFPQGKATAIPRPTSLSALKIESGISGGAFTTAEIRAAESINQLIKRTIDHAQRKEPFTPAKVLHASVVTSLQDPKVEVRDNPGKVHLRITLLLLASRSEKHKELVPTLQKVATQSKHPYHALLLKLAALKGPIDPGSLSREDFLALTSSGGFIATVAGAFATLDRVLTGSLEISDIKPRVPTAKESRPKPSALKPRTPLAKKGPMNESSIRPATTES